MDTLPSKSVTDISWRFGVTVASSGTDEVGKTFVQLKIFYKEDLKTKSLFTEMNLRQFYKFLHDLEKTRNDLGIT